MIVILLITTISHVGQCLCGKEGTRDHSRGVVNGEWRKGREEKRGGGRSEEGGSRQEALYLTVCAASVFIICASDVDAGGVVRVINFGV